MQYPTVDIVIATYNAEKTIGLCLKSISQQNYPKSNINIIVVDGDSNDRTRSIARKYTKNIIVVPSAQQNAEYNKGVGVRQARAELILMLDHDNVLPHKTWLKNMVQPILEHPEIIAAQPLRYHHDFRFSLIDRYLALVGGTDPLAIYLGKADKLSYWDDTYRLFGKATNKGDYYLVVFDRYHIPTLGANGFLIRRKILMDNAKTDERRFFHIDVNVDLIRKGYNTYAFIDDSIIHLSGYENVFNYFKRRVLFVKQYYIQRVQYRRYSVYEKNDRVKLLLFVIFSITFVKPFIDAVRGFRKVSDPAWFLHPFVCFALVLLYGCIAVQSYVENVIAKHGRLR